ncbi:conserved domain protein [Lachnospiraceae bacterium KM106-2]|nr:conserved domain protein [Lachnospiraceae bacterium KM106-2]
MRLFQKIITILGTLLVIIGIVIVVVAVSCGGHLLEQEEDNKNFTTVSMEDLESTNKISSIRVDGESDKVQFEYGDEFKVVADKVDKDKFKVANENGTLVVEDKTRNGHKFLGMDITFFNFHFNNKAAKIVITIPKDFVSDTTEIHLNAGEVSGESLQTNHLILKLNAGSIDLDQLVVKEDGKITVNGGSIDMDDFNGNNMDIALNAGSVEVSGKFSGNNRVECNAGSAELNVNGSYDDYYFKYDVSAGNVEIDGESYHKDGKINSDKKDGFDLDCSVGSIDVDFDH